MFPFIELERLIHKQPDFLIVNKKHDDHESISTIIKIEKSLFDEVLRRAKDCFVSFDGMTLGKCQSVL